MNRNLLRGKLMSQGKTLGDLAEELGISQQALSAKVSGRHKFNSSQISTCITYLDLSPNELMSIFFADEVE